MVSPFPPSRTSLAKDLEVKRKAYAAAQIPEYWVINLQNASLRVFREPVQGDYCNTTTLTTGEIIPLAFPEVAIAVQKLLVQDQA